MEYSRFPIRHSCFIFRFQPLLLLTSPSSGCSLCWSQWRIFFIWSLSDVAWPRASVFLIRAGSISHCWYRQKRPQHDRSNCDLLPSHTTHHSSLSSALEAGNSGEHNRRKGQGQPHEQLRDQQFAELAIIGGANDGTCYRISDLPCDDISLVEIFRSELA